ncbi:hydroxyethylthiazole kinase [Paraburkholderia sp. J12]|uniref:hydroxyethylthiazole kinase n=1 Tax=Paraburkholderia sp. J12 TaxID=2805432 RepID=UPI002ABD61EC|nr:hydroxyethylthiazole kinase [Paraburkholderia sp. J12]
MQTISWNDAFVREEFAVLRRSRPFVYGLTNYVAASLSANVLLAVGAAPAIGAALDWPSCFAAGAGAVWINGAALICCRPETLRLAARSARDAHRPWVLDPVAFGAGSPVYDEALRALLEFGPAVIRGNASELISLAGGPGAGKGVDTAARSIDAVPYIRQLARDTGAVVAVSGDVDYVTNGDVVSRIEGGDVRLTRVTGAGCSLGAFIAALLAQSHSALNAACAAHAIFALAAQQAASVRGTGSFAVAFVDALSELESEWPGAAAGESLDA